MNFMQPPLPGVPNDKTQNASCQVSLNASFVFYGGELYVNCMWGNLQNNA